MASIKLKGDTSGEVIISAPSVAGASTLELQATNGTIATTADINTFYNSLGNRNLIINGKMQVAQRGTSVSGITSENFYTVDRWRALVSGGTWTQSQDTDVPPAQGFGNSVKMLCTTANPSLAAGNVLQIRTRLEGQNVQQLKYGTTFAESLTYCFWIKSNKTGTYISELYNIDATKQVSKTFTINDADTWEKKTITFDGDTLSGFDNDNDNSFQIGIFLSAGTNYTSGTLQTTWTAANNTNRAVGQVNLADAVNNYVNITGVQLEAGTTATPFEHIPYGRELERCNRYFFNFSGTLHGGNYSTSGFVTGIFPTEMRIAPTITYSSARTPLVGIGFGYTKPEFFSGYMGANPYVANLAADAEL